MMITPAPLEMAVLEARTNKIPFRSARRILTFNFNFSLSYASSCKKQTLSASFSSEKASLGGMFFAFYGPNENSASLGILPILFS